MTTGRTSLTGLFTLVSAVLVSGCGRGGFGEWVSVVSFDAAAEGACPGDWRWQDEVGGCGIYGGDYSLPLLPSSAFFYPPVGTYRFVRGRIRGLQSQSPDAFGASAWADDPASIDGVYAEGVSITVGSPRRHLWTFAAGFADDMVAYPGNGCPCVDPVAGPSPPWLGGDWVCDSSMATDWPWPAYWAVDDPLWDDGVRSDCTPWTASSWFERELPEVQSGPIEVRILFNEPGGNEELAITGLELEVR